VSAVKLTRARLLFAVLSAVPVLPRILFLTDRNSTTEGLEWRNQRFVRGTAALNFVRSVLGSPVL